MVLRPGEGRPDRPKPPKIAPDWIDRGGCLLPFLLVVALALSGCLASGPVQKWSAQYTVQGQDYDDSGYGSVCPSKRDIAVGHTNATTTIGFDGNVHMVPSQTIWMTGVLKQGTCEVK